MSTRKFFRIAISFAALALVLGSCAPPTTPSPASPDPTKAPEPRSEVTKPTATPKPAAGQPRYAGVLTRAVPRDTDTFDVQQGSGSPVSLTLFNVYDGLVRLHPAEHNIVGELAEKWEIGLDGKSYIFKFHSGITWHDGKPFTMEDVIYSLDRMLKPKEFKSISPRGEGLLAAMGKAEIVGEDAVKITTKYPSATFLLNLATGWIAIEPKHILVAKGDMKRDIVGTGPFKLKSFQPDVSLELDRNPSYFIKGRPYLDGIKFYTIKDEGTRFSAFRTGQVKMTFLGGAGLNPAQAEIVRREMADRAVVYEHEALSRCALTFNLARKPWDDLRVRKAVDLALDKQAAGKIDGRAYLGSVYPAPWGMKTAELEKLPGYRQAKDTDIVEAKGLMAEAGYAQGLKTTIMTQTGAAYERQALVAQDQLAKIGIDAQVNLMEGPSFLQRRERRDFDLISFYWADTTGDPDEVLNAYYVTSGSRNYSGFSNKEIDELTEKQAQTMDEKARGAVLSEIEKKLLQQAPMINVFWTLNLTGAWSEVKNFKPGPGNHSNGKFDQVWLAR